MGKAHPLHLLLGWLFFFFRKCALLIWTFFLFNLRSQGLLRAGKRGRCEEQSARSASQQTGRRRTTTTRVSKHFKSKCVSIDKAEEVKPETKPSVTNPIHCFFFPPLFCQLDTNRLCQPVETECCWKSRSQWEPLTDCQKSKKTKQKKTVKGWQRRQRRAAEHG